MRPWIVIPFAMVLALSFACESSGQGGREIVITQTDDGCTPDSFDVTPGEKLKITARNETGNTY